MDIIRLEETIAGYRDALTVKRVFGEAYEKDGVTIIPAASVVGGGGGGQGEREGVDSGTGTGTGFGLIARPAGAFVIKGDEVRWQPAIDVTRIAGLVATYGVLRLLLRRRRR